MQRTHLLRDLGFAGALGTFLDRIPALRTLSSLGSLSFTAEEWSQDAVAITGLLTLQQASEIQLWDLKIALGESADDSLQLPFEVTAPAPPLRTAIYAAAWLAELVPAKTVVDALQLQDIRSLDDALALFSGDYAQLALEVGPLPLRLTLNTDLLVAARHVRDAQGAVIGVEPGESDLQISLSLGEARLRIDANGVDAQLLGSPRLELPPLMLAGTALALELTDLELKLDDGPLPAGMVEFSAEHGFDEQWRGLFAGTITLWNLHKVFPGGPANDTTLPASVQANAMAIDGRGLSGKLSWVRHLQDDAPLALERADIQFDRSWHPLGASATGRLDLSSLGARLLQYRASLEFDPFAGADERWRCDVALETTGTDQPLLRVDSPTPALAAAMGIAAAALGDNDAALLLSALAAGHVGNVLDIKQVSLQSATLDGSLSPAGLTLDIRLALHADIDIVALSKPTPLTLGSGELRLAYDSDSGFNTQWTLSDGLELILPLEVDIAGLATLERVSLLRRNDGYLALELGMEVDGSGDLVIGGLPDLITLLYDPKEDRFLPPQFRREGQELTLLVPGTLYAKGVLRDADAAFPALGGESWGDALAASLTVYLIGNGKASEPADHLNPDFYLYALDVGLLTATRSDGLKALLLNGDLSFRPGLPLGTSGVALYGLGLNYAQNAQPNATDGDYPDWFMRQSPQFSTHVSKWQPQGGHWGFGAAVTLGSQPDDGRSWNVAAGMFLLLPGPVLMITGKGSLFSSPPQLPVGNESASISAPFAATVALDLHRDAFTAELAADLKIGAGNRNLLELAIPARIEATLGAPVDMELSVGRFMPLESRVRGKALSLFDISAYIMVTTRGLQNFPRDGLRLPPFAIAYGGSGALSAGFSSAIAELRLKVQAAFDMGVSLAAPPLMVGQLGVEGSLVARLACIGIDIGLRTDLLVVAPRPFELGGRATLRVKLPWPIPDIRFSGSFRIGSASKWPDDYPKPEDPIAGLSLFPRPNGANVLQWGESFDARELEERNAVHGVPVDTGILIAFRAPVGNDHPRIGLVSTQADDLANPVWEIASSGYTPEGEALRIGWRHVLTDIELREIGGTAQAVKAGWGFKAASGCASGGQGDRRELHLMAPLDAPVERRYGSGVEVLGNVLQSWRPCDPPLEQKSLRVSYSIPPAKALQVVTTSTRLPEHFLLAQCWQNLAQHGLVQAADVRIKYEPASLRTGGLYPLHDIEAPRLVAMPAGIALRIENPLERPDQLLSLPVAVFTRQRDAEQAQVISAHSTQPAGRLLIDMPEEGDQQALYFLIRNGVQLDLRTEENQRVTASPIFNGTLSHGADEVWQLVRLILPERSRRISAGAAMARVSGGGFFGTHGALFVGASHFLPHAAQQAAHERQREATVELVDAVAADAASWAQGGSQGLLKPATVYELTLKVESRHARQQGSGALELGGDAIVFTRKVRFRTESDIAQPLLPRMPAAAWAPEVSPPWCVDTRPAPEGYLYRADPVEVRLADAVAAGRIAAHGRTLQLQLEHESGELLSERADDALAETKKEISKLQDVLAAHVSAQPCLGLDEKPLWLTLRQRFKTLLQPGRYRATLLAVDESGKRPHSVLHEWRLRASRWETFSAHVQAHRVQVIAQAGSAAQALPAVLAAMDGKHRIDEALLETLLHDTLGHPPMPPSATPHAMAVLRADGCGWLLLDGPEPLLSASSQILLTMNGRPVAFSGVATNAARTRSLLCLQQPVSGALSLRLGEQGQSAHLAFTVPTLTEFLESP